MKILYVEDEIGKHIDNVLTLFDKYLTLEIKNQIDKLIEKTSEKGKGISGIELREVINNSDIIHIEYRFPDALKELSQHYNQYDLIIVDRNLSEEKYTEQEIQDIKIFLPVFKKEFYAGKEGGGREGDYLLHYLFCKVGEKVLKKFYFLSAYSDDLSKQDLLEYYVNLDLLTQNNFIPKNNENIVRFRDEIVNEIENLTIRHDNLIYLKTLKDHINNELAKDFFSILKNQKNIDYIEQNVDLSRKIYESISRKIIQKNKINFKAGQKNLIDYLEDKDEQGKPNYKNYKLNSGPILCLFGRTLYYITSSNIHKDYESNLYKPSLETVQALVSMLKGYD